MADTEREVSWRAVPFGRAERTVVWHAIIGAVALVLVGISIWQRNTFFAIFIVLAAVLVSWMNRIRPTAIEFSVDDAGVSVGGTRYEYREFTEFSYRSGHVRLDEILLHRQSLLGSHLHLPIDAKLGANVRKFVATKLPETDYHETFIELFSDFLGF